VNFRQRQAKWRYPSPTELPVDIFYDSDKLMRTISLFFMDNKMDNYKIDPDNQMYFMDITGLRVVIRNCSLFEQNPKWHLWQKEIGDIRNGLAHNTFMKVPETTFSQQLKELIAEHVRPLYSFAFGGTFGDRIRKGNKTSAKRNQ